ncbi:unnamed protein product [Acanthoscelides obtectus]|uniref:BED-type domain-containing protein n=1 Tax=Acanthoscelides obtectus TaxID=200917 RepID=A0A9P0LZF6_ACAOB|nr:unnamed protein product [Acanthoscelides obtectus]CAK1630306.1 Zinc finger BED domain-containing protein 4 [Acanthoscelides obtectus]
MVRRNRSAIWNHFDKSENLKAKCKYCSQNISIANGSLGNLSRHMKAKHPTLKTVAEREIQGPLADGQNLDNVPHLLEPQPATSNMQDERVNTAVHLKYPVSSSTLREYFVRPVPSSKAKNLDLQLVRMIVKEYQPISIVEDKEFKKFVNMLNPGYSLPTRKTISQTLIPNLYLSELEKLKNRMQYVSAANLTVDSWTSINNENFIGVTVHFFSDDLNLSSALLNCECYGERHTAENLSKFLLDTVKEFNMENKIAACTTDNAPNMIAAVRRCQWRHLPCFAHTLNLVVQEAIKEIGQTIKKVKSIVEFFKRSLQAQSRLTHIQEQMSLPPRKLKQDVETRWNSTYMLSRIMEVKEAVISTLAILENDLSSSLSSHDWKIIQYGTQILKLFQDVTNEISAEKTVTLSKTLPILKIMRRKLHSLYIFLRGESAPIEIMRMMEKLSEQILKRSRSYEDNELA